MTFHKYAYWILLFAAGAVISCSSDTTQPPSLNFAENDGGLTLPDGFQAVVVTDTLGYGRHIAVDSDGDIYVALRRDHNGNGIAALRDTDGDGVADVKRYFGNLTGTGIALHNGYLYFGSDTAVVRYSMQGVDLVPDAEPEIVAGGFPVQNQHATKSFTFDNDGHIYVNVGGPSNACQEETRTPGSRGQDPCPQLERHGGIWQFNADTAGQTQVDDGYRYATGIRNAVALTWNDMHNQLYALQHGRDQLSQFWPDYYTVEDNAELPSEEFLKVDDGDNFGWPHTYYDHRKGQKMLAPEYGGDGETPAPEGEYEDPIMAFPGHWGPNDIIFYTGDQFPASYRNGAFIAFHGSWNRAPLPQQGYKVVFVPFEGDTPAGDYETFAGADTLETSRDAEYRPTGLAQGPDGSLYITDSVQGKVWRIVYVGN